MSYQSVSVTSNQFNKLRQGKILFQARLDLHQNTCEQAEQKIQHFIQLSHMKCLKSCLIIHGKGQGLIKNVVDNVLRTMYPVIAFHSAKACHGGTGAIYVLLR